jgi:hypothetical protein
MKQKIEGGKKNDMLEIGNMTYGGLKPTKIITDEKDPIFKIYQDKDKTLQAVIFTEKGIWKLTNNN